MNSTTSPSRPVRNPRGFYPGGGTFNELTSRHADRNGSAAFHVEDIDRFDDGNGILDIVLYDETNEPVATLALTDADTARISDDLTLARLAGSNSGIPVTITDPTEHGTQTANRDRLGIITFAGIDATVTHTTDKMVHIILFEGADQTAPAPALIALPRDHAANLEAALRARSRQK
ncbi:hypothetical protein [Curtobacterium sp. MCBD17_040]|uniref:hypothetical protein n=1 Tax=Curtobacterium sp. MCBD17_040 TaxID=2175674 RepID=UPI000DA78E1D|nr:hypothetical protein [Curtobacterium sp. MCBD17_040]WIB65708.1 hypothetical protein DEI94_16435 [Curtobacterium sp. MCBD17_040]